ncbi:DUF1036 domain-containing protein [Oceanicella sp. SM1341]|uniref:DUF1036 domain-containing protein n=1 Tax=Oceanicella sp. SM1341 TaxID=1548889 RepID=UPI000E4E182F|nr:DUF1036 domain-containing protein [Oceanicella sp. SM1341]
MKALPPFPASRLAVLLATMLAVLPAAAPPAAPVAPAAPLLPAGARERAFEIILVNRCDRRIQVGVNMMDTQGDWSTRGWFPLEPGESTVVGSTRNRIYYVYAETIAPEARRLYWYGEDIWRRIRGSQDDYGFLERRIDREDWGPWSHRFTCD